VLGGARRRDRIVEREIMTINADTSALAGEDSAVRAVFGELSKAWADGDTDAFAGWFTEDATGVLPGFYLRDKDAIRASMAVVAYHGCPQDPT
jgi:uncharacterized protein (TIGR02246 family)